MKYVTAKSEKISLIREQFSGLIGRTISGYEVAQIWHQDAMSWSNWNDIPLFLSIADAAVISISWNKFDDLGISHGRILPFSLAGATVRWVDEGIDELDAAIGMSISSVALGRGEMNVEGKDVEVWTRLLIGLSNGSTLEIFNALDENGYAIHVGKIVGEVTACI